VDAEEVERVFGADFVVELATTRPEPVGPRQLSIAREKSGERTVRRGGAIAAR
jgi:hypothetical protein